MSRHHKMAYKFLKADFAKSLMERGALRIGTAAEFRIPDGLEGGRSDRDELSAEWQPGETTMHVTKDSPFANWYGLKVPNINSPTGGFNLQTSSGTILRRTANAYMFCASHELTSNMSKK